MEFLQIIYLTSSRDHLQIRLIRLSSSLNNRGLHNPFNRTSIYVYAPDLQCGIWILQILISRIGDYQQLIRNLIIDFIWKLVYCYNYWWNILEIAIDFWQVYFIKDSLLFVYIQLPIVSIFTYSNREIFSNRIFTLFKYFRLFTIT